MNCIEYEAPKMKVCQGVAACGMPIYLFPRTGFQTKYAFLAVQYGGCDRRFRKNGHWKNTPAGIAHFLEHKMFDMPGYNAMETLTAMGASPNAFTANGMTGYLFSCVDRPTDNLRELIRYVTTPYFTDDSVAKEQGIIAQEIRMGDDNPSRRVRQELMKLLYREHPARDSIAGTVQSISGINAKLLNDCYDSFYIPSNMVLCCAGEWEPDRVEALVNELLPVRSRKKPPIRNYGREESLLPTAQTVNTNMEVSMPLFMLGSRLSWCEDGEEWSKLLLLADVSCELLMGEGAPLYTELYREELISRDFYSGSFDIPQGGVCCAGGRSPRPLELMERISAAAVGFRADSAARERLTGMMRAREGKFIMMLDSLDGLCHTQAEGHFGGWNQMNFGKHCREITPELVERFLHETFAPERIAISTVTPTETAR